jgi:hypothetical protein
MTAIAAAMMVYLDPSGYGSAEMLAWLVHERGIEPQVSEFAKADIR